MFSRGECQEQILKFSGARYKKFATRELALEFVNGTDNPAEGNHFCYEHPLIYRKYIYIFFQNCY